MDSGPSLTELLILLQKMRLFFVNSISRLGLEITKDLPDFIQIGLYYVT